MSVFSGLFDKLVSFHLTRLALVAGVIPFSVLAFTDCTATSVETEGNAPDEDSLKVEVVATGLRTPWEIALGPDGMIWFTERGGKIKRLNLENGQINEVGTVPNVFEQSESGLMGMAFHPDWSSDPYLYVAHSYSDGGTVRNRLIRMRYEEGKLGTPQTLIDAIPGSSIHDGSRLAIGPDGFLYMTTGDAGNTRLPQDTLHVSGKILRLTLEGKPAPGNPYPNGIWSIGHRNPQGLLFSPETRVLYSSEHGPATDDEVNIIESGRNYGWPDVHGYCDNNIPRVDEKTFCERYKIVEPIAAWTPTIAPAGIAFYGSDRIPGWKNSLLMTTLKGSALYRLQLSPDGRKVVSEDILFKNKYGRLRDVLVTESGDVYFSTSNHDGRGSPTADDDRILRIRP